LMYRRLEAGPGSHEIWLRARLPAVATGTADGGALALSLDDVGGVRFGDAARCRCDLGGAGDDVGVVGLGLGDHSASLAPVGLGDGFVAGGDASLGGHIGLGLSDDCGAGLHIVYQHGSGDDRRLGGFWIQSLVLTERQR
jgi:hypothetical protein